MGILIYMYTGNIILKTACCKLNLGCLHELDTCAAAAAAHVFFVFSGQLVLAWDVIPLINIQCSRGGYRISEKGVCK